MPKKQTIAITGANGFLGSQLVDYFAGKGWQVIGLVRNPQNHPKQPHVEFRAYDITKPVDSSALTGVDYLVHAAYIKYSRSQPNALEINIKGAESLLAASRAHGVKKNIFISSMSAHDAAESVYGKQKLAIEKLFTTKRDVSLRCGLIIGEGGIVGQMVAFMRSKHVVPLIGGGTQPLQSVSVTDLCRVVERCIERDVHGVLTIANPTVFTYKTFYQTIAKVFGIKVIFLPVPLSALVGAATLIEVLRLPVGFGKDNVLGLKQLRSSDNTKDLKKLDIELDTLEVALRKSAIQ